MYINITQNETGNNKGSSGQLVTYLEKENRVAEKLNQPEYKKICQTSRKTGKEKRGLIKARVWVCKLF